MTVGWSGFCEPLLVYEEFQTTAFLNPQPNTDIITTHNRGETSLTSMVTYNPLFS